MKNDRKRCGVIVYNIRNQNTFVLICVDDSKHANTLTEHR